MNELAPLDRRKTILDAAFGVFVTYGFKRTTMADIAEAAGMSRPALYLVFKNKSEIYAAKFHDMLEDVRLAVRQAFAGHEDFRAALLAAIDITIIAPHRMIAGTPHGAELFDVKQHLGDDLAEQWFFMFEDELKTALERQVAEGRMDLASIGLDVTRFTRLVMSSMEGIKMRMTSIDEAAKDFEILVEIVCIALEKRSAAPASA